MHFQESLASAFILEIYRVVYNVETKIRHISYLKFLSVDRGAGKLKKKKSYALSVLPLAWTPVHEMRDQTKSRELTSYHQGNKTC